MSSRVMTVDGSAEVCLVDALDVVFEAAGAPDDSLALATAAV